MADEKEKKGYRKLFFAFFFILITTVVLCVYFCLEAKRLSNFNVDLFVICNESTSCTAEGNDGMVKVADDNLKVLKSVYDLSHGKYTFGHPKADGRKVSFEFQCHKEKWNLDVEEIGSDRIRLNLQGPRNYEIYVANRAEEFDDFAKIASAKGSVTPNKLLKAKE